MKISRFFVRFVFLFSIPCVSFYFNFGNNYLIFSFLLSLIAVCIDSFRLKNRGLPFYLIILLLYAFQLFFLLLYIYFSLPSIDNGADHVGMLEEGGGGDSVVDFPKLSDIGAIKSAINAMRKPRLNNIRREEEKEEEEEEEGNGGGRNKEKEEVERLKNEEGRRGWDGGKVEIRENSSLHEQKIENLSIKSKEKLNENDVDIHNLYDFVSQMNDFNVGGKFDSDVVKKLKAPLSSQFDDPEVFYINNSLPLVSIIVASHNEHKYIERTIKSIIKASSPVVLHEILVIDDNSSPPMSESYNTTLYAPPLVKLIRNEKREGLIRSKILGGNLAEGEIVIFLDGHVKPDADWLYPIIRHINSNYKRVVVPKIPVLDGETWEMNRRAVGIKMMFEWNFNFHWFEDHSDWVPVMSGGLLAISKQWWNESGALDDGMLFWGGENIEQSIRVWLCGGEIVVARDSIVAHVFRSKFPYVLDNEKILINKVRTAEMWFDEYKEFFYSANPYARGIRNKIGDVSSREEIKKRLKCKPFQWFIDKFKDVFMDRSLLPRMTFLLREKSSGLCISPTSAVHGKRSPFLPKNDGLTLSLCNSSNIYQRFSWKYQDHTLLNIGNKKCLDASNPRQKSNDLILFGCDEQNPNQVFQLEDGRITFGSYCVDGELAKTSSGRLMLDQCRETVDAVIEINEKEEKEIKKDKKEGGGSEKKRTKIIKIVMGQIFELIEHQEIKDKFKKK